MTDMEAAGSDLVRILAKLTDDVERFDSIVLSQRQMLVQLRDDDNDRFNRQAERISVEAAQMVARARQALDKLSRLAEPAEPCAAEGSPQPASGVTQPTEPRVTRI